jgi:hypothetical protein
LFGFLVSNVIEFYVIRAGKLMPSSRKDPKIEKIKKTNFPSSSPLVSHSSGLVNKQARVMLDDYRK